MDRYEEKNILTVNIYVHMYLSIWNLADAVIQNS